MDVGYELQLSDGVLLVAVFCVRFWPVSIYIAQVATYIHGI